MDQTRATAIVIAVAFSCAAVESQSLAQSATAGADALRLPFETYTLPNGLTVILSQRRDDADGRRERLVPRRLEERGGRPHRLRPPLRARHVHRLGQRARTVSTTSSPRASAARTTAPRSNDRTTYYETVPSNYLESALWLEADRMGFLLDSLDLAKLNAQRDIVKNERRQGVDNQPYGRAGEILAQSDLSGVASVFVGRHRQHGGSVRGVGRGREELLPPLLRAEQRLSRRSSATSIRRRPRPG